MSRKRSKRTDYPHFETQTTRWQDNDVYGHMNNVVFYEYVDSTVNRWLINTCAIDIPNGPIVGLVVETSCTYHAPLGFPNPIDVGLRVEKIGTSSVVFKLGIFAEGASESAADATFTHVYVDTKSRRPVSLPDQLRAALTKITAP